MKTVRIELPGIKAVSRNETGGAYWSYRARLIEAEQWAVIYGREVEYHFTKPVIVFIDAYYDVRSREKITVKGVKRMQQYHAIDAPNIDDKIFTDILNRYKPSKLGKVERPVWFIEDDTPAYLLEVRKRSIPSDEYKVVITITEYEQIL